MTCVDLCSNFIEESANRNVKLKNWNVLLTQLNMQLEASKATLMIELSNRAWTGLPLRAQLDSLVLCPLQNDRIINCLVSDRWWKQQGRNWKGRHLSLSTGWWDATMETKFERCWMSSGSSHNWNSFSRSFYRTCLCSPAAASHMFPPIHTPCSDFCRICHQHHKAQRFPALHVDSWCWGRRHKAPWSWRRPGAEMLPKH